MGNVFYCIPEIYMQGARCCTGNQQCRCVRYTLCLQGGRSTRVRDSKTCRSGVFKEVGAGGDEEGGGAERVFSAVISYAADVVGDALSCYNDKPFLVQCNSFSEAC